MKFNFKDINDTSIYNKTKVMFVAGQYHVFNNLVADKLKELCKGEDIDIPQEILMDFGLEDSLETEFNTLGFTEFLEVVNTPCMNGKWYCRVYLSDLSDKEIEKMLNYAKKPSDDGVLVIIANNFFQYRTYLKNRVFEVSETVNLIQVNFPTREQLVDIVKELFLAENCIIDDESVYLFIMRMSRSYDDYKRVIGNITNGYGNKEEAFGLSYDQVFNGLRGIDNFIIEDMIRQLLVPIETKKIARNRKIYKMWNSLMKEFGATTLVNKINKSIKTFIKFRLYINSGIIPVKVRFSVEEAKSKIEDKNIKNMSDYRFRECARIASLTSIKDWVYMDLITTRNEMEHKFDDKLIYQLIHRRNISLSMLNNDIGFEDLTTPDFSNIDSIKYIDRGD